MKPGGVLLLFGVLALASAGPLGASAWAAPKPASTPRPSVATPRPAVARPPVVPGLRVKRPQFRKLMSLTDGAALKREVFERERAFFRAGVAYDEQTGMTFDGHRTERATGELKGSPRSFSAPSKESLHLILLAKAIAGNQRAQALLTPDPTRPEQAVAASIAVLEKKMSTLERFDADFPGFGGFLPWFNVGGGKIVPTRGWTDRVPSLDNGQLAWSLYLVASTLKAQGEPELAARYAAHLDLMKRNVVPIFYDPAAGKLRTEAKLGAGASVRPAANRYLNNQPRHFLDDDKEGLLMAHFADLLGEWKGQKVEKEKLWQTPRRQPITRRGLTAVAGDTFSSHEDWGFLVLPYRDVPLARQLFENAQKARTRDAAEHGWTGLRSATHRPVAHDAAALEYVNTMGVSSFARGRVTGARIFTPYAAFPLALNNPRVFSTWLSSMLEVAGMWGPNGVGESYASGGRRLAPILTWDGKALLLVAMMGGIAPELRTQLKHDGLYEAFLSRTRADYARFDGKKVLGSGLAWSLPAMN